MLNLSNVGLIARREYLERVKTRGFLIATLAIPVLMGVFIFGSGTLATKTKSDAHVVVATSDAVFGADLKHELETGKRSAMSIEIVPPTDAERKALDASLKDKDGITGYLWVTPAANPADRATYTFVPRSAGDIATKGIVEEGINTALTREALSAQGMSAEKIDALLKPVKLDTSSTGDTKAAYAASMTMFMILYMVIMLYGMNTARSIIEEKTSRVYEVLLSSITADEMLAGKILGVGAVGLTQISIWALAAGLLSASGLIAAVAGGAHIPLSGLQLGSFVMYFLFGFLLYSSIAAGLGAMTNSEQELQQLNMFLVMPLACCTLLLFVIIPAPNGPVARIASLIPFFSPLLMNLRISLTTVAPWEIGLSVVLMAATIFAILWVSSRIYRVGVLMYGKRPNLPEILRWLRYS